MRRDVVEQARKYLGVRWVHQGRARRNGLDCLGLVVVVMQDLGYEVEDDTTYQRLPSDQVLLRKVSSQMDLVEGEPEAGDILLIHFKGRNRSPYHFGIYTGEGTMVHGYMPDRKVVEHSIGRWSDQIHSVYRVPSK